MRRGHGIGDRRDLRRDAAYHYGRPGGGQREGVGPHLPPSAVGRQSHAAVKLAHGHAVLSLAQCGRTPAGDLASSVRRGQRLGRLDGQRPTVEAEPAGSARSWCVGSARAESHKPAGFTRERAIDLVDDLLTQEQCNFVTDYSHYLSIQVISQFIGIPREDVPF